MPEMHLKQPWFTYGVCGPFIKKKERIQQFKETGDSRYIYKNEKDEACFQHDMAFGDFKDVARGTASDKILREKHLILLKIRNMMDIKEVLLDKICKYMTSISKNVYIDKLDDIINKYNNTYHRTIKIKS